MARFAWTLLAAVIAGALFSPGAGNAEEAHWKSIGLRGSLSATPNGTFYHQYELSGVYSLPWSWRNHSGWGVATQMEAAVGVLRGQKTSAFIGSVGPDFAFGKPDVPLEVEAGVDAAFLSRPTFGTESFEGDFQFISHVGLNWRFTKRLGVGYRFQHMSNAGMYGGFNPGLNVHMAVLNYYLAD